MLLPLRNSINRLKVGQLLLSGILSLGPLDFQNTRSVDRGLNKKMQHKFLRRSRKKTVTRLLALKHQYGSEYLSESFQ